MKISSNQILGGGKSLSRRNKSKRLVIGMLLACLFLSLFGGIGAYASSTSGQTVWEYGYTGSVQSFTAPSNGKYLIKMHGASGGGEQYSNYKGLYQSLQGTQLQGWAYGGAGGYLEGYIDLAQGETVYICIGGKGERYKGGYNGGGDSWYGYGGGGCTSITTTNRGELKNFGSYTSEILLVSGGGGGLADFQENYSFLSAGMGNNSEANYKLGLGVSTTGSSEYGDAGGGGGGYKGGHIINDQYLNGLGGREYASSRIDGFSVLVDTSHIKKNGDCTIELVSKINPTVVINMRNAGTINGQSTYTAENLTAGSTFSIPSYRENDGYDIEGWRIYKNYGWTKVNGNSITVTLGTTYIEPIYLAPIDFDWVVEGDEIRINWAQEDSYDKGFIVQESLDGVNFYDILSSEYEVKELPEPQTYTGIEGTSGTSPGGIESYKVTLSGKYQIEAWGAQGTKDGQGATGGRGGYVSAVFELNAGDTLYIAAGGRENGVHPTYNIDGLKAYIAGGFNGGGFGWSSGSGGGASHVALNSNRGTLYNYRNNTGELLVVAGGGGGGSHSATNGGAGGREEINFNGARFGQGQHTGTLTLNGVTGNGVDGGAGGGGYTGGAAGYDGGTTAGGGTSYVKSTGTEKVITSGNNAGVGRVTITPLEVLQPIEGNQARYSTYDIVAPDVPNGLKVSDVENSKNILTYNISKDYGNTAWYRVRSVTLDTYTQLRMSEAAKVTAVSGTKGYWYYIDTSQTGKVSTSNSTFTYNTEIQTDTSTVVRYLHIAAIDHNGNISGTAHLMIPASVVATYRSRLNNNSVRQADSATTMRTEVNGNTDYTHGVVDNGLAACTGNGVSTGSVVNGKTKYVTCGFKYGDLLFPRAYWTINIDLNGSDSYNVNKGTTKVAQGNSEVSSNIYSTFMGWSIDRSIASDSSIFTSGRGYLGVTSDSYVGIDKNTTVMLQENHNLYANWKNEPTAIGVPKREYTITFKDSDRSNIGEFVITAGGTVNSSGDLVKNHQWLFEGWYNRECNIQSNIGGGVDHASLSQESKDLNLGTMEGVPNKSAGYLNDGTQSFIPTSNVNLYAHWTDAGMLLPKMEKVGYEFLGWYTKPQSSTGQTSDGDIISGDIGKYYGGADKPEDSWDYSSDKSLISADGDLTLYAWWNRKPIFVDIYEGLFFEGQQITYRDLLELVGVWDYEDNYSEMQEQVVKEFYEELINKIDQNIATDESELENLIAERDMWVVRRNDPSSGDIDYDEIIGGIENEIDEIGDRIHKLLSEKEQREQELAKKLEEIPDRARLLEVRIAEISYYGVNKEGTLKVRDDHRTETVASNSIKVAKKNGTGEQDVDYDIKKLKTSTSNIGAVDIIYQVRDEGITYKDESGAEKVIPDSDVTIEYSRRCQINFNYNPMMYLVGTIYYSDEELGIPMSESVKKQQASYDNCDVQDNVPWWGKAEYKGITSEGLERLLLHTENDNTIQKLQDSIVITGVKDFEFSTAFLYEHKDVVERFVSEYETPEGEAHSKAVEIGIYYIGNAKSPIYDKSAIVDELQSFNGSNEVYYNGVTKGEIWSAIKNFGITLDTCDQWGKWASSYVSEQSYEDPDTGVDTSKSPEGYIPEFNGGNETGVGEGDGDKPYDKSIYQNEDNRTVKVIILNRDSNSIYSDNDLVLSRVRDNVRYINDDYIDTLGESYWGTYGKEILKEILNKNKQELTGGISHKGNYNTENGYMIEVEVKDYTE